MSENSRQYIKALYALHAVAAKVPEDAVGAADDDAVAQFTAFTGRTAVSA